MAHAEQFQFFSSLAKMHPEYFKGGSVAEIGSLNINGSIREFFNSDEYTGFDISGGPGVDQVQQAQLIQSPTGYYDAIISAECFEHNPFWVETFSNMLRMTRPGGLIIISCATTGRPEHGTTRSTPHDSPLTAQLGWNYYQNLDADNFLEIFHLAGWFAGFHFLMCPQTCDLYFYGFRLQESVQFDEDRFINEAIALEGEIYMLNRTIRIGFWTKKTGWVPR